MLTFFSSLTTEISNTKPQIIKPTPTQEPIIIISKSLTETNNSFVYQDIKNNFTLEFPETWKGYVTTTDNLSNRYSVGFSFRGIHQPYVIFRISYFTKRQWDSLKDTKMYKILEQPDGSIITCDGCCNSSEDTTGEGQFDIFQVARCKEVPFILKTLNL